MSGPGRSPRGEPGRSADVGPGPGVPVRARLAALPAHVVARDYPETVAVFRRHGVDLPTRGGDSVVDAAGQDADALIDALERAIAWREGGLPA